MARAHRGAFDGHLQRPVVSCHFLESTALRRLLFGTPIISGPRDVRIEREDGPEGALLRASHDGYARDFGIIHGRSIKLSADGASLEGEDSFTPFDVRGLPGGEPDEFAIRFHLHPTIKASRAVGRPGRHPAACPTARYGPSPPSAMRWRSRKACSLPAMTAPRRAVQIVIYGHAREHGKVRWSFGHTPPAAPGTRVSRADEPELPL